MKNTTNKFVAILFLFLSFSIFSQTTISYDKKYIVGNLEVAEASISDKGISLILSEVDTRNKDYDGNNVKPHYKIIVDVNSLSNLKFPIKASDSVMLNTTSLQQNLNFNLKAEKFANSSKGKKLDVDAKKLRKKAASKQERIKALSKRVANGDMTALKEIEKISKELTNEAENIVNQVDVKEEKEKSTFGLSFIDTKSQVESRLLAGHIYIKEFNKNRFVAVFSGKFITECASNKKKCEKKKSTLIPQIKLLKEGDVKGQINVSLKKVHDDR